MLPGSGGKMGMGKTIWEGGCGKDGEDGPEKTGMGIREGGKMVVGKPDV